MNDLPVTLEEVADRLKNLEQRVHRLEDSSGISLVPAAINTDALLKVTDTEAPRTSQDGGMFPLLGKAMLGIAGAYVLRAVAESATLPMPSLAAIAIAYAAAWLVSAVRVKDNARTPSFIYATTSTLILLPMLWELTLRFHVLLPEVAALILAVFVLAALALSWKRRTADVLWIASLAAAPAALALAIATHRIMSFIAALIVMDLLCEYAALCNRAPGPRPFVAAVADAALWVTIFIYAGPGSSRLDYPPLGSVAIIGFAGALFLLSVGSIAVRAALRGQNISIFETAQASISLGLVTWGAYNFAPRFGLLGIGVSFLLLGVACYAIVIARVCRMTVGRNEQIFMAWGTPLLLIGSVLCPTPIGVALSLGTAASVVTLLGTRFNCFTLRIHGLILLVFAAIGSGLLAYIVHALVGPHVTSHLPGALIAAASATFCYMVAKPEISKMSPFQLLPAAIGTLAVLAFFIQASSLLLAGNLVLEGHHMALIRTFCSFVIAVAVAFTGGRFDRGELVQIAYAFLVLLIVKLLFEDLRQGHFAFIAASIFLYAMALIVVPRLTRTSLRA